MSTASRFVDLMGPRTVVPLHPDDPTSPPHRPLIAPLSPSQQVSLLRLLTVSGLTFLDLPPCQPAFAPVHHPVFPAPPPCSNAFSVLIVITSPACSYTLPRRRTHRPPQFLLLVQFGHILWHSLLGILRFRFSWSRSPKPPWASQLPSSCSICSTLTLRSPPRLSHVQPASFAHPARVFS